MRRTGARLDLLEREAADSGSGVRLECVVLRSRPESDEALRLQDVSQSDFESGPPQVSGLLDVAPRLFGRTCLALRRLPCPPMKPL
jgi:hypothetical protein